MPTPFNIFAATSPDLYQQQLALQQQQAMAQNLMQQGQQPIDPARQAGGFTVPISPMEGLTKMGTSLAGALMQKNSNQQQGDLAQKQMQALIAMIGGGAGATGTPQPPQQNPMSPDASNPSVMAGSGSTAPMPQGSPTAAPAPQAGGGDAMAKYLRLAAIESSLGPAAGALAGKEAAPTETAQLAGEAGLKPGSPEYVAAMRQKLFPPQNVRPGGTVLQGDKPIFTAPQGSVFTQWNQGQPSQSTIPGALPAITQQELAKTPARTVEIEVDNGRKVRVPESSITGTGSPVTPGPLAPGNVTQGQSTLSRERATQVATSSNKYVDEMRDAATHAVGQNRTLNELQQNLAEITPGKIAAFKKSIAQWKIGMKMGDENDARIAASSEASDKITGQLVSSALKTMTSRPTQAEFQIFLQKFVPGMEMTPQGAQKVIEFMRQSNNMSAQKYDDFQKWKKAQPADTDYRDFDVAWNRQLANAPLQAQQSFGELKQPLNAQDIVDELRKRGRVK